jgi:hypothetical protein
MSQVQSQVKAESEPSKEEGDDAAYVNLKVKQQVAPRRSEL